MSEKDKEFISWLNEQADKESGVGRFESEIAYLKVIRKYIELLSRGVL